MTIGWCFDNTYSKLPDPFKEKIGPVPVKDPKLIILNKDLSKELNLDFSMTHDWYDFDSENNVRINKIRKSGGIPSPRLIIARFSTGLKFAGKRKTPYSEIDNISESIKNLFKEISDSGIQTVTHGYDKSGESTVTGKTLIDKVGNVVVIDCYDWSDKFEWWDQLRITIATKYYANYKKKFLN